MTIQKSSTFFRFGDGQRIASSECVKIPAKVGNKAVFISVDIIEKDAFVVPGFHEEGKNGG